MSVALALTIGVLFGVGTWLLLSRSLTRIVLGLGLIGHGAHLALLASGGRAGTAPFSGEAGLTDPLPHAMVLTAIVIAFAMAAYLLALAYRSWQLRRDDLVEDDLEDRRIARLGRAERQRRAVSAPRSEPRPAGEGSAS